MKTAILSVTVLNDRLIMPPPLSALLLVTTLLLSVRVLL